MNRFVATICAVVITSLLWAAMSAQAIEVAGVNLADLSHYGAGSLHSEAAHGSRANGLVIVAYANAKDAERYCRKAAPFVRKGATVRAVFAAGVQSGKTFDVYYNGESYVRANKSVWPRTEDFAKVLAWAVDLQSVDLRLAAKQREADALEKEIEDLDRKIDAHDRVLELSRDPDINK
ncbi:MAG: hypothetical protein ACOY4D_03120 [Pseudomonadota bacterium]